MAVVCTACHSQRENWLSDRAEPILGMSDMILIRSGNWGIRVTSQEQLKKREDTFCNGH